MQHVAAFLFGAATLGVGALARLVNSSFTEKLPNIERDNTEENSKMNNLTASLQSSLTPAGKESVYEKLLEN